MGKKNNFWFGISGTLTRLYIIIIIIISQTQKPGFRNPLD